MNLTNRAPAFLLLEHDFVVINGYAKVLGKIPSPIGFTNLFSVFLAVLIKIRLVILIPRLFSLWSYANHTRINIAEVRVAVNIL